MAWDNSRESPYQWHIMSPKNKKMNRIKVRRKKGKKEAKQGVGIRTGRTGDECN